MFAICHPHNGNLVGQGVLALVMGKTTLSHVDGAHRLGVVTKVQ